jgi:hypothetical protein
VQKYAANTKLQSIRADSDFVMAPDHINSDENSTGFVFMLIMNKHIHVNTHTNTVFQLNKYITAQRIDNAECSFKRCRESAKMASLIQF